MPRKYDGCKRRHDRKDSDKGESTEEYRSQVKESRGRQVERGRLATLFEGPIFNGPSIPINEQSDIPFFLRGIHSIVTEPGVSATFYVDNSPNSVSTQTDPYKKNYIVFTGPEGLSQKQIKSLRRQDPQGVLITTSTPFTRMLIHSVVQERAATPPPQLPTPQTSHRPTSLPTPRTSNRSTTPPPPQQQGPQRRPAQQRPTQQGPQVSFQLPTPQQQRPSAPPSQISTRTPTPSSQIQSTQMHPSTQTHPQPSVQPHPQTSTQTHPQTSTQMHPQTSTQMHPQTSTQMHPQPSTQPSVQPHPQPSVQPHPQTSTQMHSQTSTQPQPLGAYPLSFLNVGNINQGESNAAITWFWFIIVLIILFLISVIVYMSVQKGAVI